MTLHQRGSLYKHCWFCEVLWCRTGAGQLLRWQRAANLFLARLLINKQSFTCHHVQTNVRCLDGGEEKRPFFSRRTLFTPFIPGLSLDLRNILYSRALHNNIICVRRCTLPGTVVPGTSYCMIHTAKWVGSLSTTDHNKYDGRVRIFLWGMPKDLSMKQVKSCTDSYDRGNRARTRNS